MQILQQKTRGIALVSPTNDNQVDVGRLSTTYNCAQIRDYKPLTKANDVDRYHMRVTCEMEPERSRYKRRQEELRAYRQKTNLKAYVVLKRLTTIYHLHVNR